MLTSSPDLANQRRATSVARGPAGPPSARPHKMKVLLVSHFHPELMRGGAQQTCYELFLGLSAESDVDAFFLAGTDPASYPALYKSGACITGFDGRKNEFIYLATNYDGVWHRTRSQRHIEAYAELLNTIRPDVVHFQHFLFLGIDFLTLTRTILPNCRIVFTFHEYLTMCDVKRPHGPHHRRLGMHSTEPGPLPSMPAGIHA